MVTGFYGSSSPVLICENMMIIIFIVIVLSSFDRGQLVRTILACVHIVFKTFCVKFRFKELNKTSWYKSRMIPVYIVYMGKSSSSEEFFLRKSAKSVNGGASSVSLAAWNSGSSYLLTKLKFFFLLFFVFFSPPHQLVHFAGEPRFVAETPDQPVHPLLGRVALVPDLLGSFLIQSEYILLHLR